MSATAPTRRRPRRAVYAPLGCLVPLVLMGLGLAAVYLIVPLLALQTFGPASPALGRFQHVQVSLRLLMNQESLTAPRDPAGAERIFRVAPGEGASQVALRLEQEGLVADGEAFRSYLIYAGMDTGIQSGEFPLSPALTPLQIALRLQDATPTQIRFGVLPGWRLEEIAASLPTSGLGISPEEFLAVANNPPGGYDFLPAGASLEGFILSKEYVLPRSITAQDLARRFLQDFAIEVTPALRVAFEGQGLSVRQAVILASIVQREAVIPEEQPMIASVFLNRLSIGMRLETDPTVQYALGYQPERQTWWKSPLTFADLKVVSVYNTYQNFGLPPGPIASPTLGALNAVAYPAQTPYFFFRAACDGSGRHTFAQSYEEHLRNACP